MADRRRILFLDMDGVLNSADWFKRRPPGLAKIAQSDRMIRSIDPEAVARLNRVVDAIPSLEIVLSSAWRLGNGLLLTRQALSRAGFRGTLIDRTPDLIRQLESGGHESVPRGEEIRSWLDDNAPNAVFAVVDDDSDMDAVWDSFVHTSFDDGLQDVHVDALIEFLSSPVPGWRAIPDAERDLVELRHINGSELCFTRTALDDADESVWPEIGRSLEEALRNGMTGRLVIEATRTIHLDDTAAVACTVHRMEDLVVRINASV